MPPQFLRINIMQVILLLFFFSCEKEGELDYTGRIIQGTCGGTVVELLSSDIGEEWVNIFGNAESYDNVVLTNLKLDDSFKVNQVIIFNFQEVDNFDGLFCDIGGLPDMKIILLDVRKKN